MFNNCGKDDFIVKRNNKRGRERSNDGFDDDFGIVHYRDPAGLRSPPGYSPKRRPRRPTKEKITLKEGSLFNMSLKFLSHNIDLLDSLVGLPEIIGKQLLLYMIQEKVLHFELDSTGNFTLNDHLKLKVLAVFDEAYNELLLESLTLENISEQINIQPLICSFQNLVELDLSGRALPDETLGVLSKFYCLEKLFLQNTRLTDKSVTKLTLPYRLFKDNPQELEILDISDNNEITNESLEYLLLTFVKLKTMNLTATSVVMHQSLVYELKQFGWFRSHDEANYSKPKTIGWAKPIITHLQDWAKSKAPMCTEASRFYSSNKKKLKLTEVRARKNSLLLLRNMVPSCTLKFNKAALLCSEKTKSHVIGQHGTTNRKHAQNNENHMKNLGFGVFFSNEDEHENQDICQQYMDSNFPSGKKGLFDSLDVT